MLPTRYLVLDSVTPPMRDASTLRTCPKPAKCYPTRILIGGTVYPYRGQAMVEMDYRRLIAISA